MSISFSQVFPKESKKNLQSEIQILHFFTGESQTIRSENYWAESVLVPQFCFCYTALFSWNQSAASKSAFCFSKKWGRTGLKQTWTGNNTDSSFSESSFEFRELNVKWHHLRQPNTGHLKNGWFSLPSFFYSLFKKNHLEEYDYPKTFYFLIKEGWLCYSSHLVPEEGNPVFSKFAKK